MKATINGTELMGIVKIIVSLLREADRNGTVQAHLGTPEFRIEREITNVELADIAAFESFADVSAPATVELEFTAHDDAIVELVLTDVMIEGPEIDYQTGKLVELIHGRGGSLELVTPQGETYTRDIPMYPNSN